MKKFRCDKCLIVVEQTEILTIPHCTKCGNWLYMFEVHEEKSDREKAIEWWNRKISGFDRTKIGSKYFDLQRLSSLTGREIEQIWRKETQQKLSENFFNSVNDENTFDPDSVMKEERSQVDFELIQEMMLNIEKSDLCGHWVDNLKLFLHLLSRSSSFAHKAHKELQKLNK